MKNTITKIKNSFQYGKLMLKAKLRNDDPFTDKLNYRERHHILPVCVGGDDNPDNLVYLSHEEHVEAHRLLVEISKDEPDTHKLMVKALRAVELDSPARQIARREEFIQKCLDYMNTN